MHTHNNEGRTYHLVQVPYGYDFKDFWMDCHNPQWPVLRGFDGECNLSIQGFKTHKYGIVELLGLASLLTEEQARSIVSDVINGAMWLVPPDPTNILESLIQSLGMEPGKTLILKKK